MDKNPLLYQLMVMRMNSAMNDVTERDVDYQASLSAVDPYLSQLKAPQLPKETTQLINDCVRAGMWPLGVAWSGLRTCRVFPTAGNCSWYPRSPERRFPAMDSYNLSYTLDPEQGNILSGLSRRCRNING